MDYIIVLIQYQTFNIISESITAAEATGEFIRIKIAGKIVKAKPMPEAHSRDNEEIVIPPEKRGKILSELRQIS